MKVRRIGALLAAPLAMTLWGTPRVASADTGSTGLVPFDAYIASGNASCVELTVATGYSFVVEPDARLPRATATISEGSSGAIAAPVDPGDSTDALAGLLVPRVEGMLASGLDQATSQFPIPVPVNTDSTIATATSPVNPHLEYPIEHANASYPNPQQPGPQQATYLGAPNASFQDPSGVLRVNGAAGDAKADPLSASADSGAGAGVSLPMLGVSIGRFAAHAISQASATAVSDDVSCSLQNVTVAPPGSPVTLHIGSLIETLHTERRLTGGRATSTHTLQLADVSINGKNVLPSGQGPITIPPGVPASYTFPAAPAVPCVPGLPCVQPPALQSISLAGTRAADTTGANNNQMSSTLTGATIVIKTTAPVPSSIPPVDPKNPTGNPLSTTPAVYTLQLGSLSSQAYGLPTQGGAAGSSSGGGGGVSGLAGGSSGGGGSQSGGSAGSAGSPGSHPVSSILNIPGTPAAIRWGVVALAALMEALLLTSLFLRRRWLQRTTARPAPSSFLDLP